MLKRICYTSFVVAQLLALTACNYLAGDDGMFRDRGGDYRDASVLPVMSVPEELDSYTLDELYVIPDRALALLEPFAETPKPKPIEANRRQGVRIQNLGDRRWIVLDATPSQVWPLVRDYWGQLEVALDTEDPGAGLMETGWLELDSDLATRHKYRVSVEPGLHSGYSEIYITHVIGQRDDPIPLIVNWPRTSSDPDEEQAVLNSLSVYLADRNDIYQASTASLLAGSIEAERKANIILASGGEAMLELRIDYDRAWVQIRQALENADITITDSDRDLAFYNVRFAGVVEEERPGFIGRILGRGNDIEAAVEQDFSVRLEETGSVINVLTQTTANAENIQELGEELLQAISDNLI